MYSPRIPTQTSWTAPTPATIATVEVQPATVCPCEREMKVYSTSSTARTAPPKPANVASRSGAVEKPVSESSESLSILMKGYLESPAARSSRLYSTVSEGKL